MSHAIPHGITLPVPGQEKEEPDLWLEDDIPSDDENNNAMPDQQREPASQG